MTGLWCCDPGGRVRPGPVEDVFAAGQSTDAERKYGRAHSSLRCWQQVAVKSFSLISSHFDIFVFFSGAGLLNYGLTRLKVSINPHSFSGRTVFWSIVGLTSGQPEQKRRSGREKSETRRVFFSRYFAANNEWNVSTSQRLTRAMQVQPLWG